MSDGLAAFWRARLDEDEHYLRTMIEAGERVATLATPKDTADAYSMVMAIADDPQVRALVEKALSGTFQPPNDLHQVLLAVEADRRILARYEDCLARMEDPDYPAGVARDQAREYEDFVIPNRVSVYRGHPDYRAEEWAP